MKHVITAFLQRFIEFGEYKDNLYGTSRESIRSALDGGKVCLVDVHAEVSTTGQRPLVARGLMYGPNALCM